MSRLRRGSYFELLDGRSTLGEFIGVVVASDLKWRVGGLVKQTTDLQWRVGGLILNPITLQWSVAPSPARVAIALSGAKGPVVTKYRVEKREHDNSFVADLTSLAIEASVDLNNDRDILRIGSLTLDPNAVAGLTVTPLVDHVALILSVLVDNSFWYDIQLGLFHMSVPVKTLTPNGELRKIGLRDLTIHLIDSTTTTSYTITSGTNYITAVQAILDDLDVTHNMPATSSTLPVDMTWPPGTTWLAIINELLNGISMYTIWPDARGVFTTRPYDNLNTKTPDVTYLDSDFITTSLEEESETARFANQIIAILDDPARAPLSSVKTNDDPDSPTSTVRLGRTISKTLHVEAAADQAALDTWAEHALEAAASIYRRATLLTQPDPRRGAHEIYLITVGTFTVAEKWWCRSWSLNLRTGRVMKHTIAKVEKVIAT